MKRILIVDDIAENAHLLSRFVELCGHTAVTASNGREALLLARQHQPDVVLIDLSMPVIDGYQTARHLRDLLGLTVPIHAVSGLPADRERIAAAGIDSFHSKPVDLKALGQLFGC